MTLVFYRVFSSFYTWFWIFFTALSVWFLTNINSFISFGIDLVGGTYLTLRVDTAKAYELALGDFMQIYGKRLLAEVGEAPVSTLYEGDTLRITYSSASNAAKAQEFFADSQAMCSVAREDNNIVLTLRDIESQKIKKDALAANIAVLSRRLDAFGVGEVLVAPKGDAMIIIELPNVRDTQQAKRMIGTAGILEFKLVEAFGSSADDILDQFGGELPDGYTILEMEEGGYIAVQQQAELTGRLLKNASAQYGNQDGFKAKPFIGLEFKPEGAEIFAQVTRENIGRQLAIILDGKVLSAPSIQTEIPGGNAQITGDFTMNKANALAQLLRSGAFAAPVKFEEERTLGPSLGQDSIKKGMLACIVGLVALFIFSVLFYKVSGLLAFIILICNLIMLLIMLSFLGATLTLPGIAGMILSIGMAIDASILIFERIKEELSSGNRSFRAALEAGFDGSAAVIIDANLTHLLISIVLYWLGSGPIQGFAVTMIVGIVATLFTGLVMLKMLFNTVLYIFNARNISI